MNFWKNNFIIIIILIHIVFLMNFVINWYFIYDIILSSLGQDFLDQYVKSNRIIMEDGKGQIILYHVVKGKEKVISTYQVEYALHYPEKFYQKNVSLLFNIIKTNFMDCTKLSSADPCKLLVINDKGHYDYLRGEHISGNYKKKPFNFFYVVQDHVYHRLLIIDKIWPPLKAIVDQFNNTKLSGSYELFLKKTFDTNGKLLLKMELYTKTLKIRTGTATVWTDNVEKKKQVMDFYRINFKLKPMLVLHYDDGYQLYTMDVPMNQYYVDLFKKFNHNLQYLKKLFKIEVVEKRWAFLKQWLYKYDSYDRKYRR